MFKTYQFEQKWIKLLQPFSVDLVLAKIFFLEIIKNYSQPTRHYHNVNHLQKVLEQINLLKPWSVNLPSIQLAAWFHDLIYNPQANNNEQKSAQKAIAILSKLNLPESLILKVNQLILSTKSHQAIDQDSEILLDADLAILGANLKEYNLYCLAIRREYHWLDEQTYCLGRKKVLENFLHRHRIYYTQLMYKQREKQARINLNWEIYQLTKFLE